MTWLFLLDCFCVVVKQTWRTSRRREEVQWGFAKVKEWSYCVARHHTLEVSFFPLIWICIYILIPAIISISEESLVVWHKNVDIVWFDLSDSSSGLFCRIKWKWCLCPPPSDLLAVCLCCWDQGSESFLLRDTLACEPNFQWGRGKTLACRVERLSAAGSLPGWVMELLSEGALFASDQPFASMTLSMGVSIQCY